MEKKAHIIESNSIDTHNSLFEELWMIEWMRSEEMKRRFLSVNSILIRQSS